MVKYYNDRFNVPLLPCPYCKPLALPVACKHARQMGMLYWPSQVKTEGKGEGEPLLSTYNILRPAKVPIAWRNISFLF